MIEVVEGDVTLLDADAIASAHQQPSATGVRRHQDDEKDHAAGAHGLYNWFACFCYHGITQSVAKRDSRGSHLLWLVIPCHVVHMPGWERQARG